LSSLPSCCE